MHWGLFNHYCVFKTNRFPIIIKACKSGSKGKKELTCMCRRFANTREQDDDQLVSPYTMLYLEIVVSESEEI